MTEINWNEIKSGWETEVDGIRFRTRLHRIKNNLTLEVLQHLAEWAQAHWEDMATFELQNLPVGPWGRGVRAEVYAGPGFVNIY